MSRPVLLLTHTAPKNQQDCDQLSSLGVAAVRLPLFHIRKLVPTSQMSAMPKPDLLVVVSAHAAQGLAQTMRQYDRDVPIVAIGPATQAVLQAQGIAAMVGKAPFCSEALVSHPCLTDVSGKRVLLVSGTRGRQYLAKVLQERGALVHQLAVYARVRTSRRRIIAVLKPLCPSKCQVALASRAALIYWQDLLAMPELQAWQEAPVLLNSGRLYEAALTCLPAAVAMKQVSEHPLGFIEGLVAQTNHHVVG